MKKKFAALILVLAMVILTGCGTQPNPDEAPDQGASAAPESNSDSDESGAAGAEDNSGVVYVSYEDGDTGFADEQPDGEKKSVLDPEQNVEIGKYVTFGHYEQDNNLENGPEPIEWKVLDIQDGRALLLSRYGLDVVQYNADYADITWAESTVRWWLNGYFLDTAFNKNERAAILLTLLDNDKRHADSYFHTYNGRNTQDRVFLLSEYEVYDLYFDSEESRRCERSQYARARGASDSDVPVGNDYACVWWLRSSGWYQDTAAYVYSIYQAGSNYFNDVSDLHTCVRPALWVNLDPDYIESEPVNMIYQENRSRASIEYFDSMEQLTPDAFDILRGVLGPESGISSRDEESNRVFTFDQAEERGGRWYFKFTGRGKTGTEKIVYILCDAFGQETGENRYNKLRLKSAHDTISATVSTANNSGSKYIVLYSSKEMVDSTHGKKISWNISKIVVEGTYDTSGIRYTVEKTDEIRTDFFFSERDTGTRVQYSTTEYPHGALKAGLYSVPFTPVFTVEIKNVGKNHSILHSSTVHGTGRVEMDMNISDMMEIWGTSSAIVEEIVSYRPNVKSILSVTFFMDKVTKGVHKQFVGKTHQLSNQNLSALKAKIQSPFRILNVDDYFQIDFGLNREIAPEAPYPEIVFEMEIK